MADVKPASKRVKVSTSMVGVDIVDPSGEFEIYIDAEEHCLLRVSQTLRAYGDNELEDHMCIFGQEVTEEANDNPQASNLKSAKKGVMVYRLIDKVYNEQYTFAWYSAYQGIEAFLVSGLRHTGRQGKHQTVVDGLKESINLRMKEFFQHNIDLAKEWYDYCRPEIMFLVVARAMEQYAGDHELCKLLEDFAGDVIEASIGFLGDKYELPESAQRVLELFRHCHDGERASVFIREFRAISLLRQTRNAMGHSFSTASTPVFKELALEALKYSRQVNFAEDFPSVALLCESVAHARAVEEKKKFEFDVNFLRLK